MDVKELNQNQLDALKWSYYYSDDYDENIVGHNGLPILFAGDIPNEIIYNVYAGICFVEEDFGISEEE